ncbi:hypothetical protein AXK57_21860 [Tsukamurella pulmonis]|nr:hypothetical protein AXK57_21860 [Tsukamurella pulmonis]
MSRVDVDKAIAGVKAGHIMAGMPMTADTEAACRRVATGASTVDAEIAAARAEALGKARTSA